MYTYSIKLQDFATLAIKNEWHNAVFVFAEEREITKLGTAPNITMQFSPFDDKLPIILVLTSDTLEPIYENTIAPNTYILQLSKQTLDVAKQTAWEYLYNYLKTFKQIDCALFAEWFSVISQDLIPINMNRNPHFEWDKPKIDVDSSDWYAKMCTTAADNNLCAVGVDRRHGTDLLALTGHPLDPYPTQLVVYNFVNLRKLGLGVQRTHTTNYLIRDTVLALQIMAEGGAVNTVPTFTVNAPTVTYTEDDIHTILELPKKFKGVL